MYTSAVSYLDSLSQQYGNLFYLESGSWGAITSTSNTFRKCYSVNTGAIFYLPSGTSLTDTSSNFYQNTATYGGNVYCDGCSMSFTSTTFKDSLAYEGSIIHMNNAASLSFNNVNMQYGKARHYGGAIYCGGTGAASISFANCAANV